MATSKLIEKQSKIFSFPVHFEGGLQSSVRAELVAELIKYILFERQQIPLSYENLKRRSSRIEQEQGSVQRPKAWSLIQNERKKINDVIEKLDETFKGIKLAFDACPEIKQAAIVLGPTSVSPKEVYKIELPPLNPEADNLPMKSCVKSLFREIVMSDPLGNVKQIHPTNAVMLLFAPRDSNFTWFCPKPLYKLPTRGKQFHISLVSTCGEGSHELTRELTTAELSGFELLDTSVFNSTENDESVDHPMKSASSESSGSSEFVCIDSDIDYLTDISLVSNNNQSTCDASEENNSLTKTLTKQSSASSILSQASVMLKSQSSLNNSSIDWARMDVDGEVDSFMESQYIWFQTPVIIKGYRPKHCKHI